MKVDQLLALQTGDQSNTAAVSDATGTRTSDAPSVEADILSAMNLDPGSPEVADLLRRNAPIKAYADLANKAKVKAPTSPAGVMSVGGGMQTDTLDNLTAELELLMKSPTKNMAKIKEVMDKQKALLPR
jgi:hypothetical protein